MLFLLSPMGILGQVLYLIVSIPDLCTLTYFEECLRIQVIVEYFCLTLALATHTKTIKSIDGKRGGSHKMLISDVCHNYQF